MCVSCLFIWSDSQPLLPPSRDTIGEPSPQSSEYDVHVVPFTAKNADTACGAGPAAGSTVNEKLSTGATPVFTGVRVVVPVLVVFAWVTEVPDAHAAFITSAVRLSIEPVTDRCDKSCQRETASLVIPP